MWFGFSVYGYMMPINEYVGGFTIVNAYEIYISTKLELND